MKKPKFVHGYVDRHGKPRYYFRRDGAKNVALPGLPWSPDFMAAYEAAMAGHTAPVRLHGAPGSIDALIAAYYKHKSFTESLATATQNMRRPILERFRLEHGDKRAAVLQRQHVIKILEGKTRNAQKNWLKTFRGLMTFAIMQGVRADDPSQGLKAVKGPKSKGHMTWLEPQVAQYREHHKLGTVARLALELLLNIAARRHDAHALGRQHITEGRLCWRPHKTLRTTGKMLKVKIIPQFQAALDVMPESKGVLNFLTNDYGRPFASAAAFGNKFADWCRAAGLKPVLCDDGKVRNYRAHGLRKAALRALAHSGCTGSEMMQVGGHSSLQQLQEYLDEVEQERQADSAMAKLMAATIKTETA
ncbi:MAG: tyrosine-type recombinase/integrase [Rhizobiales bacterium]|nr:tyrosine-type recombinase/integrase [Hyphomicrobiales bacterium]